MQNDQDVIFLVPDAGNRVEVNLGPHFQKGNGVSYSSLIMRRVMGLLKEEGDLNEIHIY
jgi:hypothetical protein